MKKILITGGAGYIGSVVVELLLKENNYHITIIDNLSEGNRKAVPEGVAFYEKDFGNRRFLNDLFKKSDFDFVIHLAASANVPDSVINPREYYYNNVTNTLTLLDVMLSFNVKNIIFSSTAAVYGEPKYSPIDEAHPKVPVNPYGYSKLIIEKVLQDYSNAYGLNYVAFRYFCAAGATSDHGESRQKETHLIPLVVDTALNKREKVKVFGNGFSTKDGTGVRDFLHVVDIARAHKMAIDRFEKVKNNFFNLGNNEGFSVLDIISTAQKHLSTMISWEYGHERPGDPAALVASNEKARKILGWYPDNNIESIILSAYNWRKHPIY